MVNFQSSRKIAFAVSLCFCVSAVGTAGYVLIEGYSFIEGFYMTVITLTTVGYGEVNPLSDMGRGFTTILIIAGFITLAYTGHAVAESLLERVWRRQGEIKKMKKQISHLNAHYIICGFGRVGASTVELFQKANASFVIIESNPEQCENLKKKGMLYIEGDATHEETLLDANIKKAKGLLAILNSDPDNLFIALSARELNPMLHIIARADDISSEKKIYRAGADQVVSPFATAGKQIADDILVATGKKDRNGLIAMSGNQTPRWITINDGSSMIDRTIRHLSKEMKREVFGLRTDGGDIIFPDIEIRLEAGNMLLILDEAEVDVEAKSTFKSKPKKIVIVDDNPVIVRLFTRLFQKAGFNPETASDGEKGLELILESKPHAAVIDYKLPKLSGLEICERVRASNENNGTKLVLFTSDESPKTHDEAFKAGADDVVLKSFDALELVKKVKDIIESETEAEDVEISDRRVTAIYD